MTGFDQFFAKPIMWAVGAVLARLPRFSTVRYAADGYNVPWDRVFQDVTTCLGYVVGLSIVGLLPAADSRGGDAMNPMRFRIARVRLPRRRWWRCSFPMAWLAMRRRRGDDDRAASWRKLRTEARLGQADLGAIDPASETIRMATLGLRGIAVTMLWNKANEYKKTEDWTAFQATLEQLARLQPYFVKVWQYQAWNLSYNVSVELDNVRDRFYYVKQGIEYLQDGIDYLRDNPDAAGRPGLVHRQQGGPRRRA